MTLSDRAEILQMARALVARRRRFYAIRSGGGAMAIEVRCVNGHRLKIKDKYAGKRGWCPYCHGLVIVPHLPNFSEDDVLAVIGPAPPSPTSEAHDTHQAAASLLGSSFIRQKKRCPHCGLTAPLWFATCAGCHQPFKE